ncbi:hypothetical protein Tco_0087884 [Tanacetum coccineum]
MDSEKEWEMLKEREAIKTLKERKLTIAELQVSDSPDEDINHSRANIHSGLLILYGEDNCIGKSCDDEFWEGIQEEWEILGWMVQESSRSAYTRDRRWPL